MKAFGGLGAGLAMGLLGLIASAVLAVQWGWNRILSGSADIALHLQVMDAGRHVGPIPPSAKAFMGEMYGYPDLGHRLAAVLTWLGIGDLNAMVLTATFVAALLWFCLLDQARRAGLFVLAVGGGLAIANVLVTRASFGAEIHSNFFFAQIVGEGFAVLALVLGQPILARSRRAYAAYAFVCAPLCIWIHLIPTLHFMGAVATIMSVEALRLFLRERKIDWLLIAGIFAQPAILLAHPYFWQMVHASENNGVVGYRVVFSFPLLAAAELLLLSMSGWILLIRIRSRDDPGSRERASTLLAALGAATAVAALIQLVIFLVSGESSAYAVRKQAFGVFSMLCLVTPLWASEVLRLRTPSPKAALVLVVALQVALTTLLFDYPKVQDVQKVDRLLADARALRLSRGLEMTDFLFVSSSDRPIVSHIVGSASLRRPRDWAAHEVLHHGHPADPRTKVTRFAARVGDLYDRPQCREGPPVRGLVVVKAACAAPPELSFKPGGDGLSMLREGWSAPEPGGVWALGPRAAVAIDLPPSTRAYDELYLELTMFAFTPPNSPTRFVRIRVGEGSATRYVFERDRPFLLAPTIRIPERDRAANRVMVVFEIENPISPKAAGLAPDDPRPLSVGLDHIRVLPRGR